MKLLNYDIKTLILDNVRSTKQETPTTITKAQYDILCNIIRRKHITKQFFEIVLEALFEVSDWRTLSYSEMYQLIYVLSHFDYQRIKM